MRFRLALTAFALVLAGGDALSQETSKSAPPAAITEPDDEAWSFSASASTYIVPDFREYVQPTFTADRGWLHLEGRYNYENLETGSIWLGYNFGGGEKLEWEFTPMLGGVFGETSGVAPGYKFSLTYWKIEFSSEGEWVFDLGNSDDSFFYNWSELSMSPVDWFRFGLVGQRTRVYQTESIFSADCSWASPTRKWISPPTCSIWTRVRRRGSSLWVELSVMFVAQPVFLPILPIQ